MDPRLRGDDAWWCVWVVSGMMRIHCSTGVIVVVSGSLWHDNVFTCHSGVIPAKAGIHPPDLPDNDAQ
jgi:hypothetical protein